MDDVLFVISLIVLACSNSLDLPLSILLACNSDHDLFLKGYLLLLTIFRCGLACVYLLVGNVTFAVVFAAEHASELVLLWLWANQLVNCDFPTSFGVKRLSDNILEVFVDDLVLLSSRDHVVGDLVAVGLAMVFFTRGVQCLVCVDLVERSHGQFDVRG